MKKKFIGFIAGFITCALLSGVVGFADDIYESIQVIRNKMNIKISGQNVEIDNFLYNGTTYVPLREISNRLNMVVTYDSKTSTAEIIDKSTYQIMSREIAFLVNGQPVRTNYFTEVMNYYKLNMGMGSVSDANAQEFKEYVKDEVVAMNVLRQIADELSIKLSTTEIRLLEEKINLYENNLGGHDAFASFLSSYGVSYETYYDIQENFALRSKVLDIMTDEITDDELYAYYKENSKNYLSEKVTAKQIFIRTTDDTGYPYADSVKIEKKQLAEKILAKIRKGEETFDDMMYKYSQDPGLMAYPGGYTFGKGEMLLAFETAAFSLNKGEVSDVVESENGYHIILVTDKYRLYESFEDVKQDIYNTLRNERYYTEVEPKIKSSDIIYNEEIFNDIKP